MSDWITDRLPTAEDAFYVECHSHEAYKHAGGYVWAMHEGYALQTYWSSVTPGQPWQPIPRPAPYVKPKRWTVTWEQRGRFILWTLCSYDQSVHTLHGDLPTDAAERIADIYNEVMP